MKLRHKSNQKGIAGIEALLFIILLAAVIGVGFWVVKQRSNARGTNGAKATTSGVNPAKAGTTAGIDDLTKAEGDSETAIDQKNESSEQSKATSTNTAQQNIGGA